MSNNHLQGRLGPSAQTMLQQRQGNPPSGQSHIFGANDINNHDMGSAPQLGHGQGVNSRIDQDTQNAGFKRSSLSKLGSGGGGQSSISDYFKVNPANGTMALSLPISISPGRSGFQPTLSLNYNSGSGNGPFGFGWSLPLGSISRKTSNKIPTYDSEDVFCFSEAEDLVQVKYEGKDFSIVSDNIKSDQPRKFQVTRYRPRIDNSPMRIERWCNTESPDDVHWRVISSDNVTTIYGYDTKSRVYEADSRITRIFSWFASLSYDSKGNAIEYTYKRENGEGIDNSPDGVLVSEHHRKDTTHFPNIYIKSMKYGNRTPSREIGAWNLRSILKNWLFEVVFDYGEHGLEPSTTEISSWLTRRDPFSNYRSGFEVRTYRLCRRILMFHHMPEVLGVEDCLVSSIEFGYRESENAAFLQSFIQNGYCEKGKWKDSLPPIEFKYSRATKVRDLKIQELDAASLQTSLASQNNNATQRHENVRADWVDLESEGAPGLLAQINGSWTYQKNTMPINDVEGEEAAIGFGPVRQLPQLPSLTTGASYYFEDLDRSGALNAILTNEDGILHGFFERLQQDRWSDFMPFGSAVNIKDVARRIDLTGDGVHDILSVDETSNEFLWHRSLCKLGFECERRTLRDPDGPRLVSKDPQVALFLSDMSGDGLTDIVEVGNGHICYWPNLGWGTFGKKVTMQKAPMLDAQLDLTQNRLFLVDVDGTGTTDIMYLPAGGGAKIYYNLAGNGWSSEVLIPNVPAIDNMASVYLLDIMGNGTTSLCWASPTNDSGGGLRYINLMAEGKPHLLTKVTNGYGSTGTVSYRPSTYYYLRDEMAGRPWSEGCKIPFVVHCVDKFQINDLIAGSTQIQRFIYHEGFYDKVEREFRGFGMVEKLDEEDWTLDKNKKFRRPPICTKTWYHNGHGTSTESPYSSPKFLLKGHVLPETNLKEAQYEIHRSMKGLELRQEILCQDGSSAAHIPFTVTENRYRVEVVKEPEENQQFTTVLRALPIESLQRNIERDLTLERRSHDLTLERDKYGQVSKAAQIFYGAPENVFKNLDAQKSAEDTAIMYSETIMTNAIDDGFELSFIPPKGYSERKYGLKLAKSALKVENAMEILCKDDFMLLTKIPTINHLEYQDIIVERKAWPKEKRSLIFESKSIFLGNDLVEPLPAGRMEEFSVAYCAYQLALTSESATSSFKSTLRDRFGVDIESAPKTIEDLGYIDLDKDGRFWSPSERVLFDLDAKNQISQAQKSFYIPTIMKDCFDNITKTKLDEYTLLNIGSIDPLGNEQKSDFDYERLQPYLVTDQNFNRTQYAYDGFGNMIATAIMGKKLENIGDSLEGFATHLTQKQIDDFIEDPHGNAKELLGRATSRTIYDPGRWYRSHDKNKSAMSYTALISRDTHDSDMRKSNYLISIMYLNGNNSTVQTLTATSYDEATKIQTWRSSGWEDKNSKENPVRVYQGYTADSHHFQQKRDIPYHTLVRDPLERVVATIGADGRWSKVKFTPWYSETFDEGDTIDLDIWRDADVGSYYQDLLLSRESTSTWASIMQNSDNQWAREAAEKSKIYAETTLKSYFSPLGAPMMTVQSDGVIEYKTQFQYDFMGNLVAQYDTLGRLLERCHFDLSGKPLTNETLDAGRKCYFYDGRGAPIIEWNSGDGLLKRDYDPLIRCTNTWLIRESEPQLLLEHVEYGEHQENAELRNLRGQVWAVQDQSGKRTYKLDFKGNCLETLTDYAMEFKAYVDWSKPVKMLYEQPFVTTSEYDALNRESITSDASGNRVERNYNLGGEMLSVSGSSSSGIAKDFIRHTIYSFDSKPLRIDYANGSHREYDYHPISRKTIKKRIWRDNGDVLEDVEMTHDITGRLTHVEDLGPKWTPKNKRMSQTADYSYDGIGRLLSAQGREQIQMKDGVRTCLSYSDLTPHTADMFDDSGKGCQYVERYKYDDAGNILKVTHTAISDGSVRGWEKTMSYGSGPADLTPINNRLVSITTEKGIPETCQYEGPAGNIGCITKMPGVSSLTWDYKGSLRSTALQKTNAGTPETTWYVYNMEGVRVRKITESYTPEGSIEQPAILKQTLSLSNLDITEKFFQGGQQTMKAKRLSSFISDGEDTIATVEREDNGTEIYRYHVSSELETDEQSKIISFENYSPFGATTSYMAESGTEAPRKYRFAKRERDTESGFYLCGARYYAPWIGRWISTDPIGIAGGQNLYEYCKNDPINLQDPSGLFPGDGDEARDLDEYLANLGDDQLEEFYREHDNGGNYDYAEAARAHMDDRGLLDEYLRQQEDPEGIYFEDSQYGGSYQEGDEYPFCVPTPDPSDPGSPDSNASEAESENYYHYRNFERALEAYQYRPRFIRQQLVDDDDNGLAHSEAQQGNVEDDDFSYQSSVHSPQQSNGSMEIEEEGSPSQNNNNNNNAAPTGMNFFQAPQINHNMFQLNAPAQPQFQFNFPVQPQPLFQAQNQVQNLVQNQAQNQPRQGPPRPGKFTGNYTQLNWYNKFR